MAGLSAAAFLALAASCAPEAAPETLMAIARVESGLSPTVIHDNTTKREFDLQDKNAATDFARQLIAAGHSVDSGIMQVNSKNMDWLGITVDQLFDECQNVRAGAEELISYSRYNTGKPHSGFVNGYVDKVVRARFNQKNNADTATSPAPQAKKPAEPQGWSGGGFAEKEDDETTADTSPIDLPPVFVQASAEMPAAGIETAERFADDRQEPPP